MTTTANMMVSYLQFARSEAVKRRQNILVTGGPNPGTPVANNANEWGGGWYVWQDINGNGTYADADGDDLIKVYVPKCTPLMDETTNNDEFIYRPNGFVDVNGSIDICMDYTNERGRQLTIGATGRPSVTSDLLCAAPAS